jgi:hypothetical protein
MLLAMKFFAWFSPSALFQDVLTRRREAPGIFLVTDKKSGEMRAGWGAGVGRVVGRSRRVRNAGHDGETFRHRGREYETGPDQAVALVMKLGADHAFAGMRVVDFVQVGKQAQLTEHDHREREQEFPAYTFSLGCHGYAIVRLMRSAYCARPDTESVPHPCAYKGGTILQSKPDDQVR